MANLSVLILDNDKRRCESLSLLLDFMEYDYQQVHSIDEANDLEHKLFDLIFLYETDDLVVRLKKLNESFSSSKVVVLCDKDKTLSEERFKQYPNFLAVLEFPVKKQPLQEIVSCLNSDISSDLSNETHEIDKVKESVADNTMVSLLDNLFVGESVVIKQVKKLITQVAKSNASVLILGESGTGKEVVANCLHQLSKRNSMPYVPVNCGAIPKDLLESELFGHEKGAFTGALTARKGRFEMAHSGSLFLDEIGDMPLAMQVKILRVLQERVFERVGGNKSLKSDVRVIAATHRNLDDQVKEGSFREDLYYRLNVFPIEIPALRERTEDIPLLFNIINQRIKEDSDVSVSISSEAMASLMQHHWPGNVRELSNLVERLGIIFMDERVGWDDLPEKYQYDITHVSELPDLDVEITSIEPDKENVFDEISAEDAIQENGLDEGLDFPEEDLGQEDNLSAFSGNPIDTLPKDNFDLKEHMATLEYSLIQQALAESDGVVAHAAKRLNMRRTTLVEKMKKYELMFGGA